MAQPFLPNDTAAPTFSARAQVSQRPIDLATAKGDLLLIFHSYQTATVAAKITRAVREVYQSPDQVLIASVADMRIVPRLLRGTAKAIIKNAYSEAANLVPAGQDPADHIIILADWSGALFKAYRVPPTTQQVALILINQAKAIAGHYTGAQPEQAALSLLAGSSSAGDS
jgi:hypothetical protein